MGSRAKERMIPVKIVGDLGEDLDGLIEAGWEEDGRGKRRSLLVTHEDGSMEANLAHVSESSWRRETCPTSPPLEIQTLPPSPAPSSPLLPNFVPGQKIREPSPLTQVCIHSFV